MMQPGYRIILIALLVVGQQVAAEPPPDTITQFSTIDALLSGVYDGQFGFSQLLQYGNWGIGTFDRLDGEMMILEGRIFQIRSDGKACHPPTEDTTPFASVVQFKPDKRFRVESPLSLEELQQRIDQEAPDLNSFCAVRIDGTFSQIKTRSVPPQNKPYPPLVEVTKNQPEFLFENVEGVLFGFRCPSYVKGINVTGYHLHFLTRNEKQGGHLLSATLKEGWVDLDNCHRFNMILPAGDENFMNADLKKDRTEELEKVEK